jgi:hypothetical protein
MIGKFSVTVDSKAERKRICSAWLSLSAAQTIIEALAISLPRYFELPSPAFLR